MAARNTRPASPLLRRTVDGTVPEEISEGAIGSRISVDPVAPPSTRKMGIPPLNSAKTDGTDSLPPALSRARQGISPKGESGCSCDGREIRATWFYARAIGFFFWDFERHMQ